MSATRAKVRRIVARLEAEYGSLVAHSRFDPVEELVSCILSQHTADVNSFPTFAELRAKHPKWHTIATMATSQLADQIRKAGLSNQKAKSIQAALAEIRRRNGDYTLEPLRHMKMGEAREWLVSLPGVGPKTAAIVLCFSFGMPAIPVDTHVFRVSWRLGLIQRQLGEAKAHPALEALVPPELAYRFHVALIQHGRTTCKAQKPLCGQCALRRMCAYFATAND